MFERMRPLILDSEVAAAAHLRCWTYFFMRNLLIAFCFLMNWTISLFR